MVTTAIQPASGRINPLDGIGHRGGSDVLSCLQGAGMDFNVGLYPVRNAITNDIIMGAPRIDPKTSQPLDAEPRYFQVIREDTSEVLGQVESRYAVQQNRTIFAVADELRSAGWKIVRAATLDKGARCFMTLEMDHKNDISVIGDIVRMRIVIHTSHDGKFATTMTVLPLRLWCLNGCSAPIPGFDWTWAIRHTVKGEEKLMEVNEMLGRAEGYFGAFERVATTLAGTQISVPHAETIIKTTKGLDNDDSKQQIAKRGLILDGFRGGQPGATSEAMNGTAWGLFQSFCDVADHGDTARVRVTAGNTAEDQRFKQAFGGAGKASKFNAWDRIVTDADLGLDIGAIAATN